MVTLLCNGLVFTFPISPAEYRIQIGNEIETFTNIEGEEKTKLLAQKVERLSFSSIFPRQWQEMWEGPEYTDPEQGLKKLRVWKRLPMVVKIDDVFNKTMLLENVDGGYRDGQMNVHFTVSFVEYNPVQTVTYSNTKQMLKPGVIITRQAKGRANTTSKTSKKNQQKSKSDKSSNKKSSSSKNAKGEFDYIKQREQQQRISNKIQSVKGK